MKATNARDVESLEQIPNIGPAVVMDLYAIGITTPDQLKGKDGIKLYQKLNRVTGIRHDPCMADTFLAVVDFMNGGRAKPWWAFTERRKALLDEQERGDSPMRNTRRRVVAE
jgi:hypothetical protein